MNVFYAQSGGVTAVINATACGVIETARKQKRIGKVYAGRNGIDFAVATRVDFADPQSLRGSQRHHRGPD